LKLCSRLFTTGRSTIKLTKRDVDFIWDVGCQHAFQALRATMVDAHVLIWPDFKRPFCLDVDWSPKGVRVILS
jgi:hypothetical protein